MSFTHSIYLVDITCNCIAVIFNEYGCVVVIFIEACDFVPFNLELAWNYVFKLLHQIADANINIQSN